MSFWTQFDGFDNTAKSAFRHRIGSVSGRAGARERRMAKRAKARSAEPLEKRLRDAFRTIEAQPTPGGLEDHVDRLTGEPPKPPRRN